MGWKVKTSGRFSQKICKTRPLAIRILKWKLKQLHSVK
ncbi:hypothetical protein MHH_c18790 [Mannheimia haemolytica M42548]|nr:hypothetical protein MHH_c18790 [Mannheimia haemolytica M42548]